MWIEEEVNIIISEMKLGGLWMKPLSRSIINSFRQGLNFLFLFLNLVSVYMSESAEILAMSVFYLSTCGLITVQALLVTTKHDTMEQILIMLPSIVVSRKRPWMKTIIIKESILSRRIGLSFKYVGSSICYLYSYLPVIIDIVLMLLGRQDPFRVPLPFSALLGLTPQRSIYYYLITISSIVYMHMIVLYCIPIQSLFCQLMVHAVTEIKIIKRLILTIGLDDKESMRVPSDFEGRLREVAFFHSRIIKFIYLLKEYYGLLYAVQNVISSISICFSFYGFSVFWTKGFMMVALLNFLTGCAYLSLMFIVCFLGQHLESYSEELWEAMYETGWYKESISVRRNLIMMIRQAEKPLNINYRGMSTLNANLFMHVLNRSYSYFMLLKSIG